MSKRKVVVASLILVIAGGAILLLSPLMAFGSAELLRRSLESGVDTLMYMLVQHRYADNYRLMGCALLCIGLARLLWIQKEVR